MNNKKKLLIKLIFLFSLFPLYFNFSDEDHERIEALDNNSFVYDTTKWSLEHLKGAPHNSGWYHQLYIVVTPLVLIMLPSSIVADTISLPYDLWKRQMYSESLPVWKTAIHTRYDVVPLSRDEYIANYNETIKYFINESIRSSNKANQLKLYFDVASSDIESKLSKAIIEGIIKKSKNSNMAGLRASICDIASQNANNPNYLDTRGAFYEILIDPKYPRSCIAQLAKVGVECKVLLESKSLPEEYIKKCYLEDKQKYRSKLINNTSVSGVIHEEIYNDVQLEKQSLIKEYGSLGNAPKDQVRQTFIVSDLAHYTSSEAVLKKISSLEGNPFRYNLAKNESVPEVIHEKVYNDILLERQSLIKEYGSFINSPDREVNRIGDIISDLARYTSSRKVINKIYSLEKKGYTKELIMNSSVPQAIHEKIYNDAELNKKSAIKQYGTFSKAPRDERDRINGVFYGLARHTSSKTILNKIISSHGSRYTRGIWWNTSESAGMIHEKIFDDTIQPLIEKYGSLSKIPVNEMHDSDVSFVLRELARFTSSKNLLKKFISLDDRFYNNHLLDNKSLSLEFKHHSISNID